MYGTVARRRVLPRFIAVLAFVAVMVSGSIVGSAQQAFAAEYPSWNDVLSARNNEKAKAAEISRLEALLVQLEAKVAASQKLAEEKGQLYFEAQQAYDAAVLKANELQAQADAANATAEESMKQAGQLAARTQRAGGVDLTATLLFSASADDKLLTQLGMAEKVNQQSSTVFAKAKRDQNTAQSLTDQADVAKAALEELAAAAEKAMLEAQAAADAANAALEEQIGNKARLQAQLATLKENRVATEQEYQEGLEAQWGSGAAGEVSQWGWARPAAGRITSNFGYRVPPKQGVGGFHSGVDLGGVGCSAPIFAGHAGTVSYAGYYGNLGYYIRIENGDGTGTGYGHIKAGGILVHVGQQVGPGQNIAYTGATGIATGCHLHYEIRVGGALKDPVPFMKARGINLG